MNLDEWRADRVIESGVNWADAIKTLVRRAEPAARFDFPKLPGVTMKIVYTAPHPDWIVEAGDMALSIGYELYDDGGVYRLRESRVEWKDGA